MVKHIYHEIIVVQYCSVAKKWAWPSKHFLACAACGLLPPRSKNPSYAPGLGIAMGDLLACFMMPTQHSANLMPCMAGQLTAACWRCQQLSKQ